MQLFILFEVDGAEVLVDDVESLPRRDEYSKLFPSASFVTMRRFWRGERSIESVDTKQNSIVKNYEHVAYNLPRHCDGAPAYTPEGRPAFSSRVEVEKFCDKLNAHKGQKTAKWD